MTLLQLHPYRELLVSRDQPIGSILERRGVIAHGLEEQHFLADHPKRFSETPGWASQRLPSSEHLFGQIKALFWGAVHRVESRADAGGGQWD